jgi:hypothetical protein
MEGLLKLAVPIIGLAILAAAGIAVYIWHEAEKKKHTLGRGEATIGWLVQANSLLFQRGPMDHPALVLISPDKDTANDEEFMVELAGRVMELKGTHGRDRDEQYVSRLVTDEDYVEGKRDQLPKSFAGRSNVYAAHVMIHREHLPERKLDGPMIHLCVIWDEPRSLICTRPAPEPRQSRRERDDEDY